MEYKTVAELCKDFNPAVMTSEWLADRARRDQRALMAINSNNPDLLAELASDEAWQVRMWVAQNKHTPVHIKEQFANDADAVVRHCYANPMQMFA